MTDFFSTGFGIALLLAAQGLLVIGFVMISLLFLVYGDRKIWAAVQMRRGPNVVGPFGLLQTVADLISENQMLRDSIEELKVQNRQLLSENEYLRKQVVELTNTLQELVSFEKSLPRDN